MKSTLQSATRTILHLSGWNGVRFSKLSLGLLFGEDAHHLGESPRLPYAAAARATSHLTLFCVEGSGQLRERDESSVTINEIKNRSADPACSGNQCSARESHYSYRYYFCNTFFRCVATVSQSRNFMLRSCVMRSSILLFKKCLRRQSSLIARSNFVF